MTARPYSVTAILRYVLLLALLLPLSHVNATDEVLVQDGVSVGESQHSPSPDVVFINDQTGYVFYATLDNPPGDGSVEYRKTEDGGSTWGTNGVNLGDDQDWGNVAVWFDQWTPGDNTGTKIHIVHVGMNGADTRYNSLDTSSDTASGWVDVVLGISWDYRTSGRPSITKATDGTLYAYAANTTLPYMYVARSIDNGGTWNTTYSPSFANQDTDDTVQLLPLSSGDILAIRQDATPDAKLYALIWTNSALAWSAETELGQCAAHDGRTRTPFSASIYRDTGDIYLLVSTWPLNGVGDLRLHKFTESSRTWNTNMTYLFTDDNTLGNVAMLVDDNNGDLYAVYQRGGDNAINYYKLSTDDGGSWGSEIQISGDLNVGRYEWLRGNLTDNERLYAVWGRAQSTPLGLIGVTITNLTATPGGVGTLIIVR